jgi:hypothetical protein
VEEDGNPDCKASRHLRECYESLQIVLNSGIKDNSISTNAAEGSDLDGYIQLAEDGSSINNSTSSTISGYMVATIGMTVLAALAVMVVSRKNKS